jgi:twitching motility protein PilT
MLTLVQLLKFAVQQGASDLHIVFGSAPVVRIDGRVVRVKLPPLTKEQCRSLCYSVLNDQQRSKFEERKELDFSFEVKGLARFRANYFVQKGAVSGVFRRIPVDVPKFESLGLPPAAEKFSRLPNGLVLVTGPTGSGKSTTLAALIDKINTESHGHIISLEDPIEFVHEHKNCIVNQREIGSDTLNFHDALKYLLRQDPDYCLVGELRDLETVEASLKLAETGHLVFGTLHTNSAVQTISRIVSIFGGEQQTRVRVQLSFVLQGVLSQRLIPRKGGGRVVASELLILTPGIRNLIREGKLHQVESMMQIGQDKTGMVTMNQSLTTLLQAGLITLDSAFSTSPDPEQLSSMLRKLGAA